jgi:hypothetical protein
VRTVDISASKSKKNKTFCTFCGGPPQKKNREHVLPQWLLKLTGDPHRKVYLGRDYTKNGFRELPYSKLTVPACTDCNSKYAKLERKIAPIVETILANGPLTRDDLILLLDWFDKVRVGMWTWYYHMDKNMAGIDPLYAIDQRTSRRDRMLIINRTSDAVQDLTYRGCDLPSFYYTPSCFNLMINQYSFTNISSPFFLGKDIGLPYPACSEMMSNGHAVYSMLPGSNETKIITLSEDFPIRSTKIFQPIWADFQTLDFYDNDFVRSMALDYEAGVGKVFLEKSATLRTLGAEPTTDWVPDIGPNTYVSRYLLSKATITLQDRIDNFAPSADNLPEEERTHLREVLRTNHEANMLLLSQLTERWKATLHLL